MNEVWKAAQDVQLFQTLMSVMTRDIIVVVVVVAVYDRHFLNIIKIKRILNLVSSKHVLFHILVVLKNTKCSKHIREVAKLVPAAHVINPLTLRLEEVFTLPPVMSEGLLLMLWELSHCAETLVQWGASTAQGGLVKLSNGSTHANCLKRSQMSKLHNDSTYSPLYTISLICITIASWGQLLDNTDGFAR